jgi:hypothetical protein
VLGEPVFERGWEFFEGKRNDVPEDEIKVVFMYKSFASFPEPEDFFGDAARVMGGDKGAEGTGELLGACSDSDGLEREVTGDVIVGHNTVD